MVGMTAMVNVVLQGRYELVRRLGEGAMGVVWLAHDRALGIAVAVKRMRPEYAENPDALAMLESEAVLCARMQSPHVVKVLGCSTEPGEAFIVYELLEGETLEARITRERTLPLDVVRQVIAQTSRALARAHALGIVHRDVKPANIFLVPQPGGRFLVKLLDFGIAVEATSEAFDYAGTPEYMPPEVLLSFQRAKEPADLYALGVVAYECLTGVPPYSSDSMEQLRSQVRHENPRSVRAHRPDLDVSIDLWMHRALHRDPSSRFPSAKHLADALTSIDSYVPPARTAFARAA